MTQRKPVARHNGANVDLTKGSIPVIIVASLLVFMAWAGYSIGGKVNKFETESALTNARFASFERDLAKIREILERNVYIKPREFKSWCAVTESINKGWKCGDIEQLRQN